MPTSTTNYGLIKPGTDDPILIGQINDNMDNIDTVLKDHSDKIDAAALGIKFKGEVDYYSDLPSTDNEVGDAYTVKYAGSSGTTPDGTEYVWGTVSGTNQWINFSKDSYTKAEVDALLALKQDALTTAQLAAVNSGINSEKVEQIETNKNNISSIHKSAGTNLYFSESQPLETIPTGSYWISTAGIKINSKTSELVPSISEYVNGYPYASTGEISPSAPYQEKTSDYIEITPDIPYEFFREGGFPVGTNGAWRCFAWFTLSKAFISRVGGNGTEPLVDIAPSNAKYVRICFRTYGESIQPSLLGDIWG